MRYLRNKNNGHCSRLRNNQVNLLNSHVERIVPRAEELAERPYFQKLREKWKNVYKNRLIVENLITGKETEEGEVNEYTGREGREGRDSSRSMVLLYSGELRLDTPLPEDIEEQIRASAGRTSQSKQKLLAFACRFANILYQKGGKGRVSVSTLTSFLGYSDPATARSQVAQYKRRLNWLIAETEGYIVGRRSKEYELLAYDRIRVSRSFPQPDVCGHIATMAL
jgi:hypothetical protein